MASVIPLHSLSVFSILNLPDRTFPFQKGAAFLLNKPMGWSSHDLVKAIRKCVNLRQVGHAGTLDPMATGLVIVCCGHATKTISQIQDTAKAYKATIALGASTESFDAETDITAQAPYHHITKTDVLTTLNNQFSGPIEQVPPMYSALKKDGTPLYKIARQGKKVARKARNVSIHAARIISFKLPALQLYIKCSKGTYIRSIAHNLGLALGSRGYLSGLHRVSIGNFHSKNALSVPDLDLLFDENCMQSASPAVG